MGLKKESALQNNIPCPSKKPKCYRYIHRHATNTLPPITHLTLTNNPYPNPSVLPPEKANNFSFCLIPITYPDAPSLTEAGAGGGVDSKNSFRKCLILGVDGWAFPLEPPCLVMSSVNLPLALGLTGDGSSQRTCSFSL